MDIRAIQRRLCVVAIAWLAAAAPPCLAQQQQKPQQQPPTIAKVPELAADRWNFDSAQWDRATVVRDFKTPADDGAPATPAGKPTEVRFAHDGTSLFVRFTMLDDAVDRLKPADFDEFADAFPQGDHGELWVTQGGVQVYAFDPVGNKYDAHNFDRAFFSRFGVKSRTAADRWESIVVIPLERLFRGPIGKGLALAFVRHAGRGDGQGVERSTATGQPPTSRITYALEQ